MSVLGIVLAILAGLFGGALEGDEGLLLGLVVGYSLGAVIQLSLQVRRLEQALREVSGSEADRRSVTQSFTPSAAQVPVTESQTERREAAVDARLYQAESVTTPAQKTVATPLSATQPGRKQTETLFDKALGFIKSFFTDGNVVVKVGLLVLFVGVGFLLKYAADHSLLPVELRVAGIGLAGVVLLALGWRLRTSKRIYALLLQGGGVGVMYLTVFGSVKLYQLIPPGAAFSVMVALVVLSGILAVLQNARYLAVYGAAGGFLAPVLVSTGTGSHIMLFSYYALLNVGILGIAWYRAWRELNLLGFVFTFVIGALWGAKYYRPEFFVSVEPFLILFFVFFVAIAVLFALRQPPQLKGYVDSTLVFGVPIIAFALQAALLRDTTYGLAFSALGISALYILLALTLWRRGPEGMRLLTEAFLALGVVFGSLAIPLATDGRWTSAAWALEGAAIIWVGVRQDRMLARAFGLLLQAGAGIFFLLDLPGPSANIPVINGIYLGAVLVSVAGLFSSYYLHRYAGQLHDWERLAHVPLLVWGLCWWFGAGLHEIGHFVASDQLVVNALVLFITGSLLLAHYLEIRLGWHMLRYPVLGQLYFMLVFLWLAFMLRMQHPFNHYGWLVWPLAIAALYGFLYRYREVVRMSVLQWQHILAFWFLILLVSWEAAWLTQEYIGGRAWRDAMYGLVPTLMMLALLRQGKRLRWPVAAYYEWYAGHAALPILLLLALYALGMGVMHAGNPWPITYLPFANPVDIIVGLILYLLILWHYQLKKQALPLVTHIPPHMPGYAIASLAFLWLNGIIARSVHHWFDIPHDLSHLAKSVIFQASISVVWTLTALSIMSLASRRGRRETWFVGLGLFIVVVLKLFLFDISRENELTMILSIIVVAVLAIVFGYYLSPLPPRDREKQT